MEAFANALANAAVANRVETADDVLLNAAVKCSVKWQERYFDRKDSPSTSRRSSVSSLSSALTELTDSEDDGLPSPGLPKGTSRRSSVSSLGSALTELTDSEDDGSVPPGIPKPPSLPSLSSSNVSTPNEAQEGAATTPVLSNSEANHQRRRMGRFREAGRRQKGRKSRMEGKRAVASFERAITVPYEFDDLKTSMKPKFERRVYRHEELGRLGIRTVGWDGRDPVPILTPSGVIIALLSGRPAGLDWDVRMQNLESAMDDTRRKIGLDKGGTPHRRGGYHCLNTGLSLGGGSKKPGELKLESVATRQAVAALRSHPSVRSLSGYVKGAMSTYAKTLVTFCQTMLDGVELQNPSLARPFKDSPFGSLTFNFGPNVRTFPHKDFKNLSWGWCSITSLGSYDPTRGGHLVLWDLGIAVEFPPNSTIFIPSAIVEHSNTEIQEDERRQSITQYTSAGLFRWCAYGFQLKSAAERLGTRPAGWWSHPHHMFPRAPPKG